MALNTTLKRWRRRFSPKENDAEMDYPPIFIGLIGTTFLLSALFTWILARLKTGLTPACEVNERSLHKTDTPRGGGLAIVVSWLLCGFIAWRLELLPGQTVIPWGMATVLMGAVSYIDDHRHTAPALRLLAQLLAVGIPVFWFQLPIQGLLPGLDLTSDLFALPFALLFGAWMINLYNFMDGMDGFAGGMALFGFGALGMMGWLQGDVSFAFLNGLIVAGALGFLLFNFPPAKIFLGDVGATVLGLLAATLSLWASGVGLIPLWISLLAFSPFIVDATVTLGLRAARREKLWQAHRSHFYQRLVCLDPQRRHRRTLLLEYALMFACALSAILALNASLTMQWLIFGIWALIYLGLMLTVTRIEHRTKRRANAE